MSADPTEARPGSGAMFDRIAHRYDLLNRVLSLGIDQRWRRRTIDSLGLGGAAGGGRLLDLATGTGDLAIMAARRQPGLRVVGVDPAVLMLERARSKVARAGLADRVELVPGDAESLPFEAGSFDGVSIAFGIRNVPDRAAGLAEMRRVTRPGGRIAVLELSEPRGGGPLSRLARFHVHTLVPWIGALLSGEREYRYLQTSIAAFPPSEEFAGMMEATGLVVERVERLTFGVCHLYVARRPEAG